jgi:hypothetical protein
MSAGNGTPPYHVDYPAWLLEKLARYRDVAAAHGLLDEYVEGLKHIHDQLRRDPTRWGDPVKRWRHAKLDGYRGKHGLFTVFYAIPVGRQTVIVREILILPPLDPGKPPF